MSTWNYRIVDLTSENDNEPWFAPVEVWYAGEDEENDDGTPRTPGEIVSMGAPDNEHGSETPEGVLANLQRYADDIKRALAQPPLQPFKPTPEPPTSTEVYEYFAQLFKGESK